MAEVKDAPVMIIGAGVSGLLLAQHLKKTGIAIEIFERDAGLDTRGLGWGLTLHWSLPALRQLLPACLFDRLPETYVDCAAVEAGEPSTFPFFDLGTGELRASTPNAPSSQRVRVARDRLRRLLACGIAIQWNKSFQRYSIRDDNQGGGVQVSFEDGSTCVGRLVVGCDGGHSRVRRILFPDKHESFRIPIRVMGLRASYTPEQVKPIRERDPYFLQGANSANDTFAYFSVLDAPGNASNDTGHYVCQMCISWPFRTGFLHQSSPVEFPTTNRERLDLARSFARTWAEPFRSLVLDLPADTEVKTLELADWAPPPALRGRGPIVLMGDAMHQMAMYRGEGANHAIVDVLDFADKVGPALLERQVAGAEETRHDRLRETLDSYEDAVVARARPGVLASRKASMDAHMWTRITGSSPLLSRRQMHLDFEDDSTAW